MTDPSRVAFLLRNTPVRELIRALEKDGFRWIAQGRRGPESSATLTEGAR